jgi:putative transposase
MPRKLRIDLPDATHHIAALAVGSESVFRESADRRRLLAQLERVAGLYEWSCRAYCLMDTHFHLIVHTHKPNLSIGMQHLCSTYAQWFNWKYARRGHLFARRFASVHITRDSHLLEAHRYVALNPVRAGLCDDPARWHWGSYRALSGLEPLPDFLEAAPVLDLFTSPTRTPQEAFRDFVLSAIREDGRPCPERPGSDPSRSNYAARPFEASIRSRNVSATRPTASS